IVAGGHKAQAKAKDREIPAVELDTPTNVAVAKVYLRDDAEEAIEGAGGDATTYTVAAMVRDFSISEPTALDLMLEHWNDTKAIPPWDPEDLAVKVRNAFNYAKNRHGSKAAGFAVNEFPKLDQATIDRINAQRAQVKPAAKPLDPSDYSVKAWQGLNIPPRKFLLQGIVATTSRILLYAPTPEPGKWTW
ncbi:MAG: hypothetical protein ACTSWI_00695, partial [Alphaproteobacteria bacterium]